MSGPLFRETVSALCRTALAFHHGGRDGTEFADERVPAFVVAQIQRMPDWMRPAIGLLTVAFTLQSFVTSFRLFHRRNPQSQARHYASWRNSPWGFQRNFVRLYESLAIFGWHSIVADDPAA
jgi:hypothetical protein